MTVLDNVLAHHGVKGMHWGVRRGRSSSAAGAAAAKPAGSHLSEGAKHVTLNAAKAKHKVSEDAITYHHLKKQVNTHSVHSLSNEELRKLTARFDLEQKYSKMASAQKAKNRTVQGRVVSKIIEKAADTALNEIGQALGKKGSAPVLTKLKLTA